MPSIEIAERAGLGADGLPRPSEDYVVRTPNAVVLLDGTTETREGVHSGGWYARRLAGRLERGLAAAPDRDLAVLLAESISGVAAEHGLTPRRSPSSTVAILRWDATNVDALVLADSPVVAFTAQGPDVLADTRLAELRAAGKLRTRADADRLRNAEGGFWVAEADPAAAGRALRRRWPRGELDAVALASDGVSIGIDQYEVLDWHTVLRLGLRRAPEAVLDTVRAAELDDPAAVRWPRAKRHDDQALVLIDFGADQG